MRAALFMGLSKFPDTLSPVILRFAGNIGNGSLCSEISLICRCRRFSYFAFDKHLFLHSRHGPVMVDLLKNFLNPLKLFPAVERFHEIAMMENGGGKEKKLNGRTERHGSKKLKGT